MRAIPNVFSLTPGPGGLAHVIEALMSGALLGIAFKDAPERLADLTVFVPHKRLRDAFEEALRVELGPRPVLLPRLRLLGAPGDAHEALAEEEIETLSLEERIISPMERRFMLAPLVSTWRAGLGDRAMEGAPETSLRETLALAEALGRLIDEMGLSGQPVDALASARPPDFDESRFDAYWLQSREFLKIAGAAWPKALRELGARDAQQAQLSRLEAETRRLEQGLATGPMLVLGSTGSFAATGKLMRAIARLDHGAVVLPGLDTVLDADDWALVASSDAVQVSLATRFAHPQSMLKRTLHQIGLPRDAVRILGEARTPRLTALSDMMRPAERVEQWRITRPALDDSAFDGLALIEAQDEREEALAIALAMRQTLETPGRTVALVTPDRALSRRVAFELARWNISAVDAAGRSLRESAAGTFALLLLDAASDSPGALMALLGHPFARFGFAQAEIEGLARALDLSVLRGHAYVAGMALAERVRHAGDNRRRSGHPCVERLPETQLERLPELAKAVDALLAPFRPGAARQSFPAFAGALAAGLEAASSDETGAARIHASAEGNSLLALLRRIEIHHAPDAIAPTALPAALALLMDEQPLPPDGEEHPRAWLLGPYEARLLEADRIILGGLNETRFPAGAQDDPFLNRAMREQLGLQAPEWRIGASAHDFTQLAATPDLVLTRARRQGDSPALPSRFLRRFEAYAGTDIWQAMQRAGGHLLALARALDAPSGPLVSTARPCPVPQVPRVPPKLSVTEIATLRRDPYAIYARHILGLVPLDPPDRGMEARDRGTLLHRILERYTKAPPPAETQAARALLEEIRDEEFSAIAHEPELFHFWRARFDRIAGDFIAFDARARAAGARIEVERRGEMALTLRDGTTLDLIGKADRVERDADGSLAIHDYKSGLVPPRKEISDGLDPQLPLLASLAEHGCLGAPGPLRQLTHIAISGGEPFEIKALKLDDLSGLAREALARLVDELSDLSAGEIGYLAQKVPVKNRAGDYDHLARRALWDIDAGDAEDEA